MPIELFGLSIGRAKQEALSQQTPVEPKATSFVLPELDDATPVDAGGYYGIGIDLDGSLRSESQYISKYREMAIHPEIEQAVEDICNEAICNGSERYPIAINLDNTTSSDEVKDKMTKELHYLLRLLDFNKRG